MEGDGVCGDVRCTDAYFYPRPPGGGRLWCCNMRQTYCKISIHALRVEGDAGVSIRYYHRQISIHALRVEGDWARLYNRCYLRISIHALRVEGDLPTYKAQLNVSISIHALRVEGDVVPFDISLSKIDFYPRPPGGGRLQNVRKIKRAVVFLSTPSGWRATVYQQIGGDTPQHFYPRPPGGGRQKERLITDEVSHFYPRPPGGGRHKYYK